MGAFEASFASVRVLPTLVGVLLTLVEVLPMLVGVLPMLVRVLPTLVEVLPTLVRVLPSLVTISPTIFHFRGKTKPILACFGGLLSFLARYWISAAAQKMAFIWG